MTTYQDPPLQSRRAARQSERLLQEQQAGAATDDGQTQPTLPAPTFAPPPAQPTPPPQPAAPPAAQPLPVPPQVPPQQNPFAPAQPPVQAQPPMQAPAPQQSQYEAAPTPVPHAEPGAPERTLTRRELRAMLDAGNQLDEYDLDDDDFGGATSAPVAAAPMPAAPYSPPAAAPPTPASPAAAPPAPAPRAPAMPPSSPFAPAPATAAPLPADPPRAAPVPAGDEGAAAAVGHWTSQLNAPVDRAEPFDQLLSRGGLTRGVPTTTNALILPSLPDQGPLGNSLGAPGEIIATGSIDLPRSYGSTGVHPSHIDSSEVDRLFDRVEDVGTGVAPVAATRAISTQGASRAMIAPPKKEGMNVPLVLAVTAGVLALGVVATLVIGAMAGLF